MTTLTPYGEADIVHGFFRAASSRGGEISLYDTEGTAYTLAEGQRFVTTSAACGNSVGGDIAVHYDDDNGDDVDAGEEIIRIEAEVHGGISEELPFPHRISKKISADGKSKPHVTAGSSGTVWARILGYAFPQK